MLTKIEQAIANVLTTNRTPDYHNVLDAYVRLCHPGGPASAIDNPAAIADMLETGLFFERAMDKYPDVGEKVGSQAPFAKWIADFRRSQWQLEIDVATNSMHMPTDAWFRFPCPCCGITGHIDDIRRKLGLLEIEAPPAKSKKLKSRRRVGSKTKSKKSNGKTLAFDPYSPSTSASSM